MSVVFVLVGQCGNQVGESVFRLAASTSTLPTSRTPPSAPTRQPASTAAAKPPTRVGPLFAADGYARCVMVDAEPKVVEAVAGRNPTIFRPAARAVGDSGRGNNWAKGYVGLPSSAQSGGAGNQADPWSTPSPQRKGGRPSFQPNRPAFLVAEKDHRERDTLLLARALRAIHDETARCDDGGVEAIVVMHSLAGGTGSGFGSALIENLRWYFARGGGGTPERDEGNAAFSRGDDVSGEDDDGAREDNQRRAEARLAGRPASIVDEDVWVSGAYGSRRLAQALVSVCVAPRNHGETTVQSFNLALTMRTVRPAVDALLLLRNDIPGIAPDAWRQAAVNEYLAACVVSTLLQGGTQFGAVGELIARACPMPSHNILTLLPVSAGSTRLPTGKTSAAGAAKEGAAPAVAPHLHAFHQSAVAAVLFANRSQPAPPALTKELGTFLHPSLRHAADVVTTTVVLPLSPAAGGGGSSTTGGGLRARTTAGSGGGGGAAAMGSLPSVLVLNQGAELARTLMFPALRDAYGKVEAKAFLQSFTPLAPLARRLFPGVGSTRAWADITGASVKPDEIAIAGLAIRHAISEVSEQLLVYPGTA